jgi:tetratricopeptide (TPR) repeat protein
VLSVGAWLAQPGGESNYEAALRAGKDCCKAQQLASLQFDDWAAQLMVLDLYKARSSAQEMLQRALACNDPDRLDEANVALSNTLFWLGDCEEAFAVLSRAGILAGFSGGRVGLQGFDLNERFSIIIILLSDLDVVVAKATEVGLRHCAKTARNPSCWAAQDSSMSPLAYPMRLARC